VLNFILSNTQFPSTLLRGMLALTRLVRQREAYARMVSHATAPKLRPEDVIAEPSSPVEKAKRLAARRAVDEYVTAGMTAVGVGSGSTIVYAIQRLAERKRDEGLDVKCVPTSFQSKQVCVVLVQPLHLCEFNFGDMQLIVETGLQLADLSQCPELDVAIDGADEVDRELNCIKGGGACQTQEKLVAAAAKKFVLVADNRKQSEMLGTQWKKGIPLEVLPFGYAPVCKRLAELGGKPVLRMAVAKAGPVVTDNGNFVVDYICVPTEPAKVADLHISIKLIPGVIETGLFPGMACQAYFGMEDGSVQTWSR
jgi:ribose 5-phosphate isomerase A